MKIMGLLALLAASLSAQPHEHIVKATIDFEYSVMEWQTLTYDCGVEWAEKTGVPGGWAIYFPTRKMEHDSRTFGFIDAEANKLIQIFASFRPMLNAIVKSSGIDGMVFQMDAYPKTTTIELHYTGPDGKMDHVELDNEGKMKLAYRTHIVSDELWYQVGMFMPHWFKYMTDSIQWWYEQVEKNTIRAD